MEKKRTILIVDDLEINRAVLTEVFEEDYDILECDNGKDALSLIDERGQEIAAMLLDMVMPGMDGLEVLREMNRSKAIQRIPVFLITAETNMGKMKEAYQLGAVDVITKPFMPFFIRHRINNVIELHRQRRELERLARSQMKQLGAVNQSLVEILATIIEIRNCESGEHVRRISGLTKTLMTKVSEMYREYRLPKEEIDQIVTSSILHDVGKISVPDSILNKAGKLTDEEYEIMKQHTVKGCEILNKVPDIMDEGLYSYAYDICRHHHERWDGRGYPDGLKGDEITIWAQVVAVADVYDALTSQRVYKPPFEHAVALRMIENGECGGTFNPKVLRAFRAVCEEQGAGA